MLLSLVIPVYNVEEYLESCIDSVLSQNDKDLEIICVNDGSTDSSRDILRRYEKKVYNMRIIDQENKGLSGARNEGILNAKGKWVMFLDSDDKLEDDFVKALIPFLRSNNDCDLVEYEYKTIYPNGAIRRNCNFFKVKTLNMSGTEVFNNKIKTNTFYFSAWNKVLKKDFLINNEIFFREGVLYEDIEFSTKAINIAENIKFLNEVGTIYYKRNSGTITTTKSKRNLERMNSYARMIDFLYDYNSNILDKQFFKNYIVSRVLGVFYDIANNCENINDFREIISYRNKFSTLEEYTDYGIKKGNIKTKLLLRSLENRANLFFYYSKIHNYLKLKYFSIGGVKK